MCTQYTDLCIATDLWISAISLCLISDKNNNTLHTQQKYELELTMLKQQITRLSISAKCSSQVKISKLYFFKLFSTGGTSEKANCYRIYNQNIQIHLETWHSYTTVKL